MQGVLSGVSAVMNWFQDICSWKSPVTTVLVHMLYLILVWYPELLLPTVFLYMFLIGSWNYRFRPRTPPFMDAKLSQGEYIGDLDELEEEFNVIPANRAQEVWNALLLLTHLNFSTLSCISSVFTGVFVRYTSIIVAISKCWTGKYMYAWYQYTILLMVSRNLPNPVSK